MEKEKKNITLFTTYIEDYDQLRKDYEEWCEDMDEEPEDDGEFAWNDNNVESYWDDFEYEVKKFDKKNPGTYFLCVGHYTSRYGFPRSGPQEGGAVICGLWETVRALIDGKDDYAFELNENGQIEFNGGHHDGHSYYTITRLNKRADKVIEATENRYEDLRGNRELNEKLDREFYFNKIVDGVDIFA